FSSTSAKISSVPAPAPAPARVIYGADPDFQEVLDRAQCVIRRAKVVLLHRKIQKLHAEINLPRARPSQTGSQVKQRFTFDHRGPAVPAATQGSTRGRSPKPVLKSILKPSTSTQIASRHVPACAPINRSGERNLCEASAEAYAAPWRSLPAREWANDKLPIERLDRWALRQQRIKKRELLADGARPKRVEFAQTLVTGFRTVSSQIEYSE
ncbi:hypothetical protein MMC22_004181, partial [Lobaria immixta]|nr:hypothetical protein [Lobaria immixta]